MANSGDPTLSAAGRSTLIATEVMRATRSLLPSITRHTLRVGERRRTIYDAKQNPDLPGTLVRGEKDPASADVTVNEAFDHSGTTYDFYREIFNRNSIDGNGMRLDSTVHFREDPSEPFDNAFWDGRRMVYGDGDGIVFGRFTQSLDVIAHELTHGVTELTAGLEYHNQSGALNESVSDVFGSMVRQWKNNQTVTSADWLIGAELFVKPGMALRSMKAPGTAFDDPNIGKDRQVGHMRDYLNLPDTRRGDNGGVHLNSGIPNKAFYQACVNLGAQYSWEKGGRIWYEALTGRLKENASFADMKAATVSVARDLFGVTEAGQVEAAWATVGL